VGSHTMCAMGEYTSSDQDVYKRQILPFTAYALLAITARRATSHARGASFGIGANYAAYWHFVVRS